MNNVHQLCSALALAMVCAHATAASTAEAKISDIHLTVIDLKLDDGLTPALDLTGYFEGGVVYVNRFGLGYQHWEPTSPDFLGTVSGGISSGANHGFASVGPTALTSSTSTDGQQEWSAYAETYIGNPAYSSPSIGGLILAPFSALHLTATGSLNLTRTNGQSLYASFDALYHSDRGQGQVSHVLYTPYSDSGDMQMSQVNPIDFLISNYSAKPMQVTIDFKVNSRATPAIPEPGTVGLLLGGLAVVAVPRLRQARNAQA